MGGSYTITDGKLAVGAMMTTEMACEEPLMAQDQWISAFVNGAAVALEGDTLTLAKDGVIVTATDREVAKPDLPVEGTVWMVEGLVSNQAVSSMPAGVEASLVFADGKVAVDTGCNNGNGAAEIGDTSITFGPVATTKMFCEGAAGEVEQQVLGVLTGEVAYTVRLRYAPAARRRWRPPPARQALTSAASVRRSQRSPDRPCGSRTEVLQAPASRLGRQAPGSSPFASLAASPVRRNTRQASVHQSAQATRRGWKKSRARRAASEVSPNASTRLAYCEMLPGKMRTKNAAVARPVRILWRGSRIRARPRAISATPDRTTTRSACSRHPRRHLGEELHARDRQVVDPREGEHDAQQQPEDGLGDAGASRGEFVDPGKHRGPWRGWAVIRPPVGTR